MIETFIANLWNRLARKPTHFEGSGVELGLIVVDGRVTNMRFLVSQLRRTQHLVILGITGMGKSWLILFISQQDLRHDLGFAHIDFHGDIVPRLLRLVAAEEMRRGCDLSERVILIQPADLEYSVGLNILEQKSGRQSFVQIAEFARILKQRWHLDSFGARTEELLRNSLYVLSYNNLTILELGLLLTNQSFRASSVKRIDNQEIQDYFQTRYDSASLPMQATLRDPILNKVSAFTADAAFRHVVGQQRSSFSLIDAIDKGYWIILDLHKGSLGEQAATLGSLFLAQLKYAVFARQHRDRLFTIFADEFQNLLDYDSDIDTLLAESRKFGCSLVLASQYHDRFPPQMRAAVLAVGSHIFFRLSSPDADKMSAALDGGKALAELLKNLPPRQMIVKSGHTRWCQVVVPEIKEPNVDYTDLYRRCRERWARKRTEVEREIHARHSAFNGAGEEVLYGWE